MSDKNKTVKLAGRKGTQVSRDKAKSFSDVQNKQKHNRKQVKVYDSDTGKTTTLQKEGNTYYRGGQYVELTDSQKEIRGASMKKYGASQKEFPEIKKGNEGKFTKWVEKNMPGMDTCKAASKIMRSRTKKYSPAVVKMANYANNFGCKNKKDGASVPLKGKQKNLPEHLKKKILAKK